MRGLVAAAVAGVLTVGLSGCAGDRAAARPSGSATPAAARSSARPTPVSLGKPLWRRQVSGAAPVSRRYALDRLDTVTVSGGTLAYEGDAAAGDHLRVVVADVRTGVSRWSRSTGDRVPGTASATYRMGTLPPVLNRDTVFLDYGDDDGGELGLAALSARDGHRRWSVPTGRYGAFGADVFAADERTVLLDATTYGDDDDVRAETTIALSARDGHELWRAPGVAPDRVVGDTVLTYRRHLPYSMDDEPPATVVALDAHTGRRRWALGGQVTRAGADAGGAGTVVVDAAHGQGTVLVDARSGRRLAALGGGVDNCWYDGRTALLCDTRTGANPTVERHSLRAIDLQPDGPATVGRPARRMAYVPKSVAGGVVFGGGPAGPVLLDRSGRFRGTAPGWFQAADGGLVLLASVEDVHHDNCTLSVYRLPGR